MPNPTSVQRAGILALLSLSFAPAQEAQATQGVVNAPVAPEAIYLSVGGGSSLAVLDLNGFGQGTGDPANTNFPNNPNVGQPGVTPTLAPGSSAFNAGSAGPLTLTVNTLGSTSLFDNLKSLTDIQLGHPLDKVFNNANININAIAANQTNPATRVPMVGNTIMVAPHPNPPPFVLPPPNPTRGILSEEPTVTSSMGPEGRLLTSAPPCLVSPINLLIPPFGASFEQVFYGPQPAPPQPPPPPTYCPFSSRQQIGHFLYALDPEARAVVVLNSNRMIELTRLNVRRPDTMAIAPNLELLAVTGERMSTVNFIDIDPFSPTFHQVVRRTAVGAGRKAMAWQPEGEDLLVTNRDARTLTLVDGAELRVRKVMRSPLLGQPVDVVATARQVRFGFETGTWFAYVLTRGGRVALFESGPRRIGADDVIGRLPMTFAGAGVIRPDSGSLQSAFYVAHATSSGEGRVSRVALTSSRRGPLPVRGLPPLRGRRWSVTDEFAGFGSGAPRDFALDEVLNQGAWPDARSPLVPGLSYPPHSGKGHIKLVDGAPQPARAPQLLITATAAGDVVVLNRSNGAQLARLAGLDARCVAGYWRD